MKKFLIILFNILFIASTVCSVVFGCLWGKANKELKDDTQVATINDLKAENSSLEKQLDKVSNDNAFYVLENASLKEQNSQLAEKNSTLQESNIALTEQVGNLTNSNENYSTQINELESQIAYYEELLAAYENDTRLPVTFYLKGEIYEVKLVEEGNFVQLADPQLLPGEHFIGWSKDKANVVNLNETPITQTTQFYAVIEYDVTFSLNNEIFTTLQVRDGATISEAPTCTTSNNENFYGYSLNGTDVVDVTSIPITEVTNFSAIVGFTVNFVDTNQTWTEIVRYNNTVANEYVGIGNAGIGFRGWSLTASHSQNTTLVDYKNYVITNDTNFYASYYGVVSV